MKPSTETLNVMLLADTTAAVDDMLLDVRTALIAFVNQVHAVSPNAQISLMEFGQAAVTAVPFTTSGPDLEKGINRLSGKPRSASVLLEGHQRRQSQPRGRGPARGAPSSRSTSSRATSRAARTQSGLSSPSASPWHRCGASQSRRARSRTRSATSC